MCNILSHAFVTHSISDGRWKPGAKTINLWIGKPTHIQVVQVSRPFCWEENYAELMCLSRTTNTNNIIIVFKHLLQINKQYLNAWPKTLNGYDMDLHHRCSNMQLRLADSPANVVASVRCRENIWNNLQAVTRHGGHGLLNCEHSLLNQENGLIKCGCSSLIV